MNHIITQGIVLSRTDFQEADRILTLLTPDHGKLRVIAKGVRRPRSKLAGGIELLSVSDITVMPGRGDISTLISTRLVNHYGQIVRDIERTMLAYELLKKTNRVTEDAADQEYFNLIKNTLEGLDDPELSAQLVELWFSMQLLKVAGHAPELKKDTENKALSAEHDYMFDFDKMAFRHHQGAPFAANHIKLLRLSHATDTPTALKPVQDAQQHAAGTLLLVRNLLREHVRL